jgi:hypothetical protein
MLEQLFCVVLEFARRQGLSFEQSRLAFVQAQRLSKTSRYRPTITAQYETLQRVSELLAAWYREAEFLDEKGAPKTLAITGNNSFSTLSRRYLPGHPAKRVADLMAKEKLLYVDNSGKVAPQHRAARFARSSPMVLDRIPVLVHGFLNTLAHNLSKEGRAEGTRCETNATAKRLPVELVPAFNENVKKWAQALLDQADTWTYQREVPENSGAGRKTARVGVEVFAYVQDNDLNSTPPRRRRAP